MLCSPVALPFVAAQIERAEISQQTKRQKDHCYEEYDRGGPLQLRERERDQTEGGRHEIELEHGGARGALDVEQSVMHVEAVRGEDRSACPHAAHDRECGVEDRDGQCEQRDEEGDQRDPAVALECEERQGVADEQRTGIAEE